MTKRVSYRPTKSEVLANAHTLIDVRSCLEDTLTALADRTAKAPTPSLSRLADTLARYSVRLSPIEPAADDAAPAAPSYLYWLPDGAVDNIIRHMSDRPRSAHWERFLADDDVLGLYCGAGPLAAVFRRRFVHVALAQYQKLPPKPRAGGSGCGAGGGDAAAPYLMRLYMRDWRSRALAAIEQSGAHFETVTCSGAVVNDCAPHHVSWIPPFVAHCTGVRSLSVASMGLPYFELVLATVARRLETLALDRASSTLAHLDFVARRCRGLRTITLALPKVAPPSLWRALGPTLEDLTFSLSSCSDATDAVGHLREMAKAIAENCRALRKVRVLSVPSVMFESIVEMLVSYGPQLELVSANFCFMDFGQCRRIAEACTKAVFEVQSLTRLTVLEDLNFRVHRLDISEMNVLNQPEIDLVGAHCNEVRTMFIRRLEVRAPTIVSGLLRLPKPKLTDLTVDLKEDNATEVLFKLAERTKTLRRFCMWVKVISSEGLLELFVANPGIEFLEFLTPQGLTKDSEKHTCDILNHCKQLKHFRELVVGSTRANPPSRPPPVPEDSLKGPSEAFADACVPLRTKNVVVRLFGTDYLK